MKGSDGTILIIKSNLLILYIDSTFLTINFLFLFGVSVLSLFFFYCSFVGYGI